MCACLLVMSPEAMESNDVGSLEDVPLAAEVAREGLEHMALVDSGHGAPSARGAVRLRFYGRRRSLDHGGRCAGAMDGAAGR